MRQYPTLFKQLQNDFEKEFSFQIKSNEKGNHYIEGEAQNKKIKIHSTYNPIKEAEGILNKYKEKIEEYEYILFFGVGLGYHISLFKEKYPNKIIYAYEPSLEIFSLYTQYADLSLINHLFVGSIEENLQSFIDIAFQKNLLLIPFPIYEVQFAEQWNKFQEKRVGFLKTQMNNVEVASRFEKSWVLNALYNSPFLMDCPSILHPAFHTYFRKKPIIIVSAGPSLNDEIENLRKIKEEGTAYIFTVGSAVNALLSHGIIPDATCSHDPSERNLERVYKNILATNNTKIPLIFGSTFFSEIVEKYPGKKAYFILSQDLINPVLYATSDEDIIIDAPTVAAVLLQILLRWKVETLIFVGQNLAFRNKQMYAQGIDYAQQFNEVERPKDNLIPVKSVTGETIFTSNTYFIMKDIIEHTLEDFQRTDTINTTVDGAQIKGTTFMRLSDVMKEKLTQPIVDINWYEKVVSQISTEDKEKTQKKVKNSRIEFLHARDDFEKKIHQVNKNLSAMEKSLRLSKLKQISRDADKYQKSMSQVDKNTYYRTLIAPFLKTYLLQQTSKLKEIKHRNLSSLEYYKQTYPILHEAIEIIRNSHKMINQDVEKVLVDKMENIEKQKEEKS